MKLQKVNRVKLTQEDNLCLLTLQQSRIQDEFQQRETLQCKEEAQTIGSFMSSGCDQESTRDMGISMMYAMCAHWPISQRLQYQDRMSPKQKRS